MLIRLRYAVLLVGALLAVYVGLWPSVLTLFAVLALPLAFVALAGLIRPALVESCRSLRRFAVVGGGIVAIEFIVLLSWFAWTPRRPVVLVAQPPVPSQVRVVYNVADGAPRSWWRWGRRHEVPAAGIVHSQSPMDRGWYRAGNRHPVRAFDEFGTGERDAIAVAWVKGGTTRAAGCKMEYDEYVLVDTSRVIGRKPYEAPSAGWLDSLSTWGVECRTGRLYRAPEGRFSELRRTGPACYYDRAGGMTCRAAAAAP